MKNWSWEIFYCTEEDFKQSHYYKTINNSVGKPTFPQRIKLRTTRRIKRYYPGGFFENIWNQQTKIFNMSYIPRPQNDDFSGIPIIQEPDDNALVNFAKQPINAIINQGPDVAQSFFGSSWKGILLAQSANVVARLIGNNMGWSSAIIGKILYPIVLRHFCGQLTANPIKNAFTSPFAFLYTAYDCYKLAAFMGKKHYEFNQYKKTSKVWSIISGSASWLSSWFIKTTPVTKNVARITGGDTSSMALDSANQIATLKQVIINNKPQQFTPENYDILKAFQDKLNYDNFNILAEKLSYKSTLTDKLAQRYINMATENVNVNQLIKNHNGSLNNSNNILKQTTNNIPLNTNNPKLIGEYVNNVQGQDAINIAENLIKNQQQTSNIINNTNIINDVQQNTEQVVHQLSLGGKIVLTAMGILALCFSYKFLNNKFPEYINLDWLYILKDKISGFMFKKKPGIIEIVNTDNENINLYNKVFEQAITNKENLNFVDTLTEKNNIIQKPLNKLSTNNSFKEEINVLKNKSLIDTNKNVISENYIINEIPTAPIQTNDIKILNEIQKELNPFN